MELYVSDNCIKCGICSEIYEEVFNMTRNGAVVNEEKEIDDEKGYDAIFYCPVGAIHIK